MSQVNFDSEKQAIREVLTKWDDHIKEKLSYTSYHSGYGSAPNERFAANLVIEFFEMVKNIISEVHSETGFVPAFIEKLNKVVVQKTWVVPSCVMHQLYVKCGSDDFLDLLLQLPHRAESQGDSMISYYRTNSDVIRGRETRTTPGRWFGANKLGTEKEGLQFNTHFCSTGIQQNKVHLLSEKEGGCSEDNWAWAYGNTDMKTGSCMIKCPDAARVYAYDNNLDLAYITDDGTPNGKIISRTILRRDKKTYIRVYYTDYRIEQQMVSYLNSIDYDADRDLVGCKLGKIKPSNLENPDLKLYWLSYIDSYDDVYVEDKGDYWLVTDDYEDGYDAQNSRGYLVFGKCACNKSGYDLNMAHNFVDGKITTTLVCGSCKKNYFYREQGYTNEYYNKNHFAHVKNYTKSSDDSEYNYNEEIYPISEVENLKFEGGTLIKKSKYDYVVVNEADVQKDIFGVQYLASHDDYFKVSNYVRDNTTLRNLVEIIERNNLTDTPFDEWIVSKVSSDDEDDDYFKIYNLTEYNWDYGRILNVHKIVDFLNIFVQANILNKDVIQEYTKGEYVGEKSISRIGYSEFYKIVGADTQYMVSLFQQNAA